MNTKTTVPSGETGASRKDGGTTGIKMPTGPARQPNLGRRSQNSRTADVGTTRGGQSEPSGNRPITASRTAMRPEPGVLANQAETSKDLQARLAKATQPFTNEGGAATLPTGRLDMSTLGIVYGQAVPVAGRVQSYGSKVMSDSEAFEASGDSKPGGYNPINGGRAPWMRKD